MGRGRAEQAQREQRSAMNGDRPDERRRLEVKRERREQREPERKEAGAGFGEDARRRERESANATHDALGEEKNRRPEKGRDTTIVREQDKRADREREH